MGTTQTPTTLFSCSVRDCSTRFNSQRELTRHEEEFHGELRHAGSQYSDVSSADAVGTNVEKGGSEEVGTSLTSNYERQTTLSSPQGEKVAVNEQGSRLDSNTCPTSSNSSNVDQIEQMSDRPSDSTSYGQPPIEDTSLNSPRIHKYQPLPKDSKPRSSSR